MLASELGHFLLCVTCDFFSYGVQVYAPDAKFDGADFTNGIVDRAFFKGSSFRGALFNNAVLSGSSFDEADLTDADFTEACELCECLPFLLP